MDDGIERIESVAYRTPDGERHGSREAAERHVATKAREATLARVDDILRRPLSDDERAALPEAGPFEDGKTFHEHVEALLSHWDTREFYDSLANLVMLRHAELSAAVAGPAPAEGDEDEPSSRWGRP